MTAAIRTAIPAGALIALALGIFLPANHDLPAVALGNRELLWAERSLLFFYGFLLLCVPLLRALHGELPIELSTRGARYAETSEVVVEELKVRLTELEGHLDEMVEILDALGEPITGRGV
jgi:hypothetical protein